MARTRNLELGPAARPISIPSDVDNDGVVKAAGRVELPFHIRWSGPPIVYDLGSRADRARVYEQVLREGTDDDISYFIDIDQLLDLWAELVIPVPVRQAWTAWFLLHRGVNVEC